MNKKLHILELIETIENRIIFDCNNDKLKSLTCSICKYCITKQKPTFVQH